MTNHPHQLFAVFFTVADQTRLSDFSCGEEPWSRSVREWILGSDVIRSMDRGTQVWLFETNTAKVVGFGSIGISQWRWPPPSGAKTTLVLIPMLGIDSRYQGQPIEPQWRYARQIMAHLLAEAQKISLEWTGEPSQKPQWLVLLVHRDNRRAIHFYEKCGFELIPGVDRQNHHVVMKVWIGAAS